MNKVEIINMVANHYNIGNRAEENGSCMYRMYDGRMCAVGMCMNDEAMERFHRYDNGIKSLNIILKDEKKSLDSIFKEEYKGHPWEFWEEIQALHDYRSNWTNQGLSDLGEEEVEELIRKYKQS